MKALVLAIVCAIAVRGSDLDELRATQQKLIAARDSGKLPREEVPLDVLALARRQLLRWGDSQLQAAGHSVDPDKLTKRLDKAFADLPEPVGNDQAMDFLGGMGVSFSRPKGAPTWIEMTISLGIPCGGDNSVYLYEWRSGRWNRRFTMEPDDSSIKKYGPKGSVDMQVSAPDAHGSRIVLTISSPPFCMSVWQDLDIRISRIDSTQRLLVEEDAFANYGEDKTWSARLEPDGALVEYVGASIDTVLWIHRQVLHYAIRGDAVRRIEPVALSAQDFVEEWLTRPWSEAEAWSEAAVAEWHARLHRENVFGDFSAVQRCSRPGQWQIGIAFDHQPAVYFSVHDLGEYRFLMTSVSENPQPSCSGRNEMRAVGDPMPSLFPR